MRLGREELRGHGEDGREDGLHNSMARELLADKGPLDSELDCAALHDTALEFDGVVAVLREAYVAVLGVCRV